MGNKHLTGFHPFTDSMDISKYFISKLMEKDDTARTATES
jgi:hypothetical protein